MNYSALLHTLYDEQNPVGQLGRGTHYSVFSAVQWVDIYKKLLPSLHIQNFAVIWDEDHDERIIDVMERAYMRGIFAPVLYIGERKAYITVVVGNDFYQYIQNDWASYIMAWENICKNVHGDHWLVNIVPVLVNAANSPTLGIIADSDTKVTTYIQNIHNLWDLGIKPYIQQHKNYNPSIPPYPLIHESPG